MACRTDPRAFVHASGEGKRSETTSPYLRASAVQNLPAKIFSIHPKQQAPNRARKWLKRHLFFPASIALQRMLDPAWQHGIFAHAATRRSLSGHSDNQRRRLLQIYIIGFMEIPRNVAEVPLAKIMLEHARRPTTTHIYVPELRLWSWKKPRRCTPVDFSMLMSVLFRCNAAGLTIVHQNLGRLKLETIHAC